MQIFGLAGYNQAMTQLDLIAFDADDTLWHNETLYREAQERFKLLLSHYHSPEWINQRLYATEMRNLEHFGYGIKSFTLSMIETAIELTDGQVTGGEVQSILDTAKGMLQAEVELLDHVEETLERLKQSHDLIMITKGDLLDQEAKLARSGLAGYFQHIEVVNQKTAEKYLALLKRSQVEPERFLMVGNSLRSDILPVLELGGYAVYIPYPLIWEHEHLADAQIESSRILRAGAHRAAARSDRQKVSINYRGSGGFWVGFTCQTLHHPTSNYPEVAVT